MVCRPNQIEAISGNGGSRGEAPDAAPIAIVAINSSMVNHWLHVPLGETVDILDSRRIPVNSEERAKRIGDVPYYGATGQVGWIDDYIFDEELVLLGEDGAPFLDSTKPKAYMIRGKAWVNNHAHVLRGKGGVLSNSFLLHQLNRVDYGAYVSGTTRLKLPQGPLRRIPLIVPPFNEQQRIVAEIEKQFTRLDAGVASLKRVRATLKRYRASVLKAASEGRLVPTEAELARRESRSYEPAEVLIRRTSAPLRPNRWKTRSKDVIPGHTALAVGNPNSTLPQGWTWSPLVEIARMESGHTPSREHPEWWNGEIPWIGIADAREHDGRVINETFQHTNNDGLANSAARLLPAGTVCVSRTASVGYVVIMGRPMATSQDFVNWIPTRAITSGWLRVVFSADREALRRFGKGSVHKTIYFPEWLSVHIAVPPLIEQRRIVAELDRRLSVLDEVGSVTALCLQRGKRLRQTILSAAFSSKLTTSYEK
jgi:type I restriction enzyme S subunit